MLNMILWLGALGGLLFLVLLIGVAISAWRYEEEPWVKRRSERARSSEATRQTAELT